MPTDTRMIPVELEMIRKQIDDVDTMIIRLLAKRAEFVTAASKLKKSEQGVRDPKRVEQVIANVREKALKAGLDAELAEQTYRTMINWFIEKELGLFNDHRTG